jgi:DNA anti-recombination protein RmuC
MSTRQEYIDKLKSKLDEWNAAIDKLEVQAKLAEMENRQKYEAEIETFKQKRDEIQERLNTMRSSGEQAFEDLRQGVEQAWDSLWDAYKKAKSHFNE